MQKALGPSPGMPQYFSLGLLLGLEEIRRDSLRKLQAGVRYVDIGDIGTKDRKMYGGKKVVCPRGGEKGGLRKAQKTRFWDQSGVDWLNIGWH